MTDATGGTERGEKNNDYRLVVSDAVAGNVEIDFAIRGNEYEAEILWNDIRHVLMKHEDKYGCKDEVDHEAEDHD